MNQDDLGGVVGPSPRARTYGDAQVEQGGAGWGLWSVETGRLVPGRYRSWAEAEAARAGREDLYACLQYDWGGAD